MRSSSSDIMSKLWMGRDRYFPKRPPITNGISVILSNLEFPCERIDNSYVVFERSRMIVLSWREVISNNPFI